MEKAFLIEAGGQIDQTIPDDLNRCVERRVGTDLKFDEVKGERIGLMNEVDGSAFVGTRTEQTRSNRDLIEPVVRPAFGDRAFQIHFLAFVLLTGPRSRRIK